VKSCFVENFAAGYSVNKDYVVAGDFGGEVDSAVKADYDGEGD
jgi:hypothetical protein